MILNLKKIKNKLVFLSKEKINIYKKICFTFFPRGSFTVPQRFTVIIGNYQLSDFQFLAEIEFYQIPSLTELKTPQKQAKVLPNPFFVSINIENNDFSIEKIETPKNDNTNMAIIVSKITEPTQNTIESGSEITDEINEKSSNLLQPNYEEHLSNPTDLSMSNSPNKLSDISNKKSSIYEESLEDFQSQKASFFKKLERNIGEFEEENVNKPREFMTESKGALVEKEEKSMFLNENQEKSHISNENQEKGFISYGESSQITSESHEKTNQISFENQEKTRAISENQKKSSMISFQTANSQENIVKEGFLLKKSRSFLSGWQVKN